MLGLVSVYNRLPARIVESASSVPTFQAMLQELLTFNANTGVDNWVRTFSPRIPWHRHPLSYIA